MLVGCGCRIDSVKLNLSDNQDFTLEDYLAALQRSAVWAETPTFERQTWNFARPPRLSRGIRLLLRSTARNSGERHATDHGRGSSAGSSWQSQDESLPGSFVQRVGWVRVAEVNNEFCQIFGIR